MKKLVPSMMLALLAAPPALAQDGGIWLGAQGQVVIPASSDLNDIATVGGGFAIKGDFSVSSRMVVRIDASFNRFGNKDTATFTVNKLTVAPWRVGLLYKLNNAKARFYVAGMAGGYLTDISVNISGEEDEELSNTTTNLGFAPGAGLFLSLSERLKLDINAFYDIVFREGLTLGYVSAGIGLLFDVN